MRILVAFMIAANMCGCVSNAGHKAILDDVTGKPPFVADYCVVAVDGKPVKRCGGSIATVIPMVELDPGTHTLTLSLADEKRTPQTVSGEFQAGGSYKIKSQDGKLSIVETEDYRETASED